MLNRFCYILPAGMHPPPPPSSPPDLVRTGVATPDPSPSFSSVVIPIYLGELAPPTLRGTLGTLTQFSLVIGILGSNLLAFPLATPGGWRWMFAVTPILAILELMCMPLILESPRCGEGGREREREGGREERVGLRVVHFARWGRS